MRKWYKIGNRFVNGEAVVRATITAPRVGYDSNVCIELNPSMLTDPRWAKFWATEKQAEKLLNDLEEETK
jgi:hypothetical protein